MMMPRLPSLAVYMTMWAPYIHISIIPSSLHRPSSVAKDHDVFTTENVAYAGVAFNAENNEVYEEICS